MGRNPEKLECDLVMRGGITSGIVYPRAIAKLAKTYNFRSIGGTSAGAIAAAATAAAQFGANNGDDRFQTIYELPRKLAELKDGKSTLERLFQPQPGTSRLFSLLMSGLEREGKLKKILRIVGTGLANYWCYSIAGAAVTLIPLLWVASASGLSGARHAVLIIAALILGLMTAILGAALGVLRDVRKRLPENRYGLCAGSSDMRPDRAGVLPLTDWLHDFFQNLAGSTPTDDPVTFGDLWGNGGDENAPRDIELVLMTTNVTRGISHRFPFLEGSWGQLYFDKSEFDQLFPKSVVDWMVKHAAGARHGGRLEVPEGFHPIPKPSDLPILLGARMSLSFPILLSAVPLYAANFERAPDNGKYPLERCWFSDGGLTSNFPIHFFDAPLPGRPTFGINLVPDTVETTEIDETDDRLERVSGLGTKGAPSGQAEGEGWDKVWMPSNNSTGISSAARFNKFDGLVGFFGALFDTARNWGDTELMAMPGYRDRVVHVKLAEDEGGLNLSMPPTIIEALGERGELAGKLLADRFAPTPTGNEVLTDPKTGEPVVLTWDNHRWARYRSFMAAVELVARRFRATWKDVTTQKNWRLYDDLLNRAQGDPPVSYPFHRSDQQNFAVAETARLVDWTTGWTTDDQTFDRKSNPGRSPRPKPGLRMMPPGANDPRADRGV
jgi:patatin-like phospholipase